MSMNGAAPRIWLAIVAVSGGLAIAVPPSAMAQSPPDHAEPASSLSKTQVQDILRAAERGDAAAQVRASALFYAAYLSAAPAQKPNFAAQAMKWARAAADQRNAGGQNNLALFYELGVGTPINLNEAMKWYRLSADQGNANAQEALGRLYYEGKGVPQDYAEALPLLLKAAEQNNAMAQNYLGLMYANGRGVAKDPAVAMTWYRRAAALGSGIAELNLATAYMHGAGVQADPMLAYFWFNVAAARLTGPFQRAAAVLRDAAAQKLAPGDIERAQAAARDWKPSAVAAEEAEVQLRGTSPVSTQGASSSGGAAYPGKVASSGTAFVVTKSGHVLTNDHVVNGCTEVRGRFPGGRLIAGEVVARDPQNDLAVVKLSTALPRVASFRSGQSLRQGDGVVVYGFPFGDALAAEGNLTTGNVSALAGLANDSRQLQISAPVQPGNSGGPVVDMSGNIVGVVVAKLNALAMMKSTGDVPQNINFAIKAGVAESFLEANGIEYQTAPSGRSLAASDVGSRAKQFTLKLECLR